MKINVTDGSVVFDAGEVSPDANRMSFLATPVGREARPELVNAAWWHHCVKPEAGIGADVLYQGDVLHRIDIQLRIPSDDYGEWTEEHELERKALHDAWLRREIGAPPYEYAWGKIFSAYDARSVVAEIVIQYDR